MPEGIQCNREVNVSQCRVKKEGGERDFPVGRSSFVKGKHAMSQELKEKVRLKEDYLVHFS